MNMIALSSLDLIIAASLVLLLGLVTTLLNLGLTRTLYIAAIRTTVQLLLIGLVLKFLFENLHLGWMALLVTVMLLVAGREVMARQKRPFAGRWGYGLGVFTMFVSSFLLTIFALTFIIGTEPWYQPQYAIPLLGMMLGNTMTGVALAMDRLTETTYQQRMVIEARLALGQHWRVAIGNIARDSARVGMLPMINAMAAAGIISLPGMMTGQILAGSPPLEAVKYQILIMFMITAGTGFATVLTTWLGARRLFDERHRLRLERLRSGTK